MRVIIDTSNKTIEIEQATTKELKKLCKDYEGYDIISKIVDSWSYPYWNSPPYYQWPLTTGTLTIECSDTLTTSNVSYDHGLSTLTTNN